MCNRLNRRARALWLNSLAFLTIACATAQLVAPVIVAPRPAAAQAVPATTTVVVATSERPAAIYKVGEKATFTITVTQPDGTAAQGKANYAFSLDGVGDYGKGTVDLVDGKATVTGALDKPGVLRCAILFVPTQKEGEAAPSPIAALGGAVYDPFEVKPTTTVPDDFAAFWDGQKAELAKIPMDAKVTPYEQPNKAVEVFDVSLANINGTRVHGIFAKPVGDGPFPALLTVPGASVRSASPGIAGWAARGFLVMDITVHDLPNLQPKEFYDEKYAGEMKAYFLAGREDRLTYEFRRIFMGCVRAVDFLTGQPSWDKKHMVVFGSSQGGALSLATAGLDSRITALSANVPAMCDHTGRLFDRPSGWPQIAPVVDGKLDPKVVEVSRYYDAVNFARRTNVPAVMGIGLIDTTCPSTTCLSAYNVLSGPKQIDIAPQMGHSFSPSFNAMSDKFILEQGGLKPPQ